MNHWSFINLILALVCLLPSYGQLPESPKPQQLDRVQWALLGAETGVRALDVYSTHQMLQNGNRELVLPGAVANHVPAMIAYSAGTVVVDWYFAKLLTKYHHRKLAYALTSIDIGTTAPWAIHNLTLARASR